MTDRTLPDDEYAVASRLLDDIAEVTDSVDADKVVVPINNDGPFPYDG